MSTGGLALPGPGRARRGVRSLVATLILAGCGPTNDPGAVADRTAQQRSERTVEEALLVTRLEVAEGRIARLERRIAELAADPGAVEVGLLRQRLDATQSALAAASVEPPAIAPPPPASSRTAAPLPTGSRPAGPRVQPTPAPSPRPQPSPRLRLVAPSEFQPQTR